MEFSFDIEKILGGITKQGVAFISGEEQNKYSYENIKLIKILLDKVGELSAHVSNYIYNNSIIGSRITNTHYLWI